MLASYLPIALLFGLSTATPVALPSDAPTSLHYPSVPLTFNGAAGASYSMTVLANGVLVPTNNKLSITSISMHGRASFSCVANGIDGSVTRLVANQVSGLS